MAREKLGETVVEGELLEEQKREKRRLPPKAKPRRQTRTIPQTVIASTERGRAQTHEGSKARGQPLSEEKGKTPQKEAPASRLDETGQNEKVVPEGKDKGQATMAQRILLLRGCRSASGKFKKDHGRKEAGTADDTKLFPPQKKNPEGNGL